MIQVTEKDGAVCISLPLDEAKELAEQLNKADYEFDCLTDEVAPMMTPLIKALLKVVDPVMYEAYYNAD